MQPHPSGNPPLVYAWLTMKREMGELELIERIRSEWGAAGRGAGGAAGCGSRSLARSVALGIGDDCAILRPPRGHELLVTTDFTLEGRHFRRDLHPPESAGHRMLARGLSDLAAMGARPLAAFLSLALPGEMLATRAGRVWVGLAFSLIRGLPSPLSGSSGHPIVPATLRYFTSVRRLQCVHAGGTAFRLFPPVCRRFRRRRPGIILSQLNHPAHLCPCLRFDGCLAARHARLGVRMESLPPFL